MHSLVIAITGIVSLMVIWLGVQTVWKSMFAEEINSEDALADRSKCGNCNCGTICKKQK